MSDSFWFSSIVATNFRMLVFVEIHVVHKVYEEVYDSQTHILCFLSSVGNIILAILKSALIFVIPRHSRSSLFLAYVVILVSKQDNPTALRCLVKDAGHLSAASRRDWAGQMPPVFCHCHFLCSFFIMSHNLTSIQSFKPWHTHPGEGFDETEWVNLRQRSWAHIGLERRTHIREATTLNWYWMTNFFVILD